MSKTAEYTVFSSAHGTFSRIDRPHASHKTSPNKFETEKVLSVFSNDSSRKPETNYFSGEKRNTDTRETKQDPTKSRQPVTARAAAERTRKYRRTAKMKTQLYKIHRAQRKQFQEGSLEQYRPTSRNRKSLKKPELPSKGIRSISHNKEILPFATTGRILCLVK